MEHKIFRYPKEWKMVAERPAIEPKFLGAVCFVAATERGPLMSVITSASVERDDLVWLHVSITRRDGHLPTMVDVKNARHSFIGDVRKTVLILPPDPVEGKTPMPYTVHLFACLEGDPLPDFPEEHGVQ